MRLRDDDLCILTLRVVGKIRSFRPAIMHLRSGRSAAAPHNGYIRIWSWKGRDEGPCDKDWIVKALQRTSTAAVRMFRNACIPKLRIDDDSEESIVWSTEIPSLANTRNSFLGHGYGNPGVIDGNRILLS